MFYDAELWRLKGDLATLSGSPAEAESYLRRALDIARQQSAKSLELRAATSLARLLNAHGGRKEALRVLQGVYRRFTEGFDTVDVKDAKSLLAELV
jgi:hypothetical protein